MSVTRDVRRYNCSSEVSLTMVSNSRGYPVAAAPRSNSSSVPLQVRLFVQGFSRSMVLPNAPQEAVHHQGQSSSSNHSA